MRPTRSLLWAALLVGCLAGAASAEPGPPDLRVEQLRSLAQAVRVAHHTDDPVLARGLLASHPLAVDLHDEPRRVETRTRIVAAKPGVRLEVTLRRTFSAEPLLVAIPPGTRVGADLALLRPAVVLLHDGAPAATLTLPLASLRPTAEATAGDTPTLTPVRSRALGSLLRALCAGPHPRDEAPAQLALWILHADLDPEACVQAPRLTLGSRRLILPLHGPSAARLFDAADLAWRRLRFFRPQPLPALPAPTRGESSS